jgi:ectoine hydroxylase-related dioxygenase (phytanoyl-CoA dioxygenase family)
MTSDWYQHFLDHGYAVVPSVISKEKAAAYQNAAFDWLKSFDNPDLDLANPATWTPENLPFISQINTFNYYGVVHERFMWDIRLEPGVVDVFARLWHTDELLVSFDALNITLPRRPGHVPRGKWPHVDISPYREGQTCVQGIVNLSHAGPDDGGLTVYPGSHKLTETYFQQHTDPSSWMRKDYYTYTPEQIAWFAEQGFKEHKVVAAPGDLIIWDSRLIHFGAEPTEKSSTIRTVTYVSYAPVSLASEETLATKRRAFEQWMATTHWPHDNIALRQNEPLYPDGSVDARRVKPRHEPELTPRLLQLAGVKPY